MTKRILIITDCIDVAANELHATVVSNLDSLGAKDVSVEPIAVTEPFSIMHASFVARLLADSYNTSDLTILVVVNPLNTSNAKRARIAGKLKNGLQFVGANTGAFTWLIEDFGLEELCETNPIGLSGTNFISFGGKYVHAPITAKYAMTSDIKSVKDRNFDQEDLLNLVYKKGTVVHIDNFGVAKLYLLPTDLNINIGDQANLEVDGKAVGKVTYCNSMKELSDGTLAIYKGSSLGILEIGIVRELDTSKKLGINVGSEVKIKL
jgi:S-adenosylmethionine hydrolase